MTITFNWKDSMLEINNEVCKTLDYPQYVQLVLNEEKKLFGIKPCEIDCEQVLVMPGSDVQLVEIPAKVLVRNIWKLMNWETENPRVCVGMYLNTHQIVVFDLNEAYEVIPGAVS